MAKSKHRVYTKEEREDRETIRKLKDTVRDLLSHNKQLKSEIATLEAAFEKARKFMSDETEDLTVEQLIEAANKHHTAKQARESKKGSNKTKYNNKKQDRHPETPEESKEEVREKWKKWREENFGKYKEDK